MTEQELQCLLSLSCISILGPEYDMEELNRQRFYKKDNGIINKLERHLPINEDKFSLHSKELLNLLTISDIHDADSYVEKINELVKGSVFSNHMDKLMQLGRMMQKDQFENMTQIMVENRPYSKIIVEAILDYQFHWPLQGLVAYDVATAILLLRAGVELGYISTAVQMTYFEQFLEIIKGEYTSFNQFGVDAAIGRNLQICHVEYIRSDRLPESIPSILSECYFGIWKYIKSDFLAFEEA